MSSGKSTFLIIIVIIIALFAYNQFSEGGDVSGFSDDDSFDDGKNIYIDDDEEINKYEFYYNQLNADEKKIYDSMKAAAAAGKTVCSTSDISEAGIKNTVKRVLEAFEHDHPEYFWIDGGAKYQWTSLDGGRCNIEIELTCFEYWNNTFNPEKYLTELNREVKRVSALAEKYSTDYEKALFVHDYLVRTADYDYDGLDEALKTIHDAKHEYIFSAYGCLVNKDTVCAGYAKAYQLILNNIGIECIYVTGYAGENHAWNMVKIDGENYYVDVTWDDGTYSDGNGNVFYSEQPVYTYFGITTDELQLTHTVDRDYFDIPRCTATEYNYFVYNDYLVTEYDEDKIESIITKQSDRNKINIKFSDIDDMNKAGENLWDFEDALKSKDFTCYFTNKNHGVIVAIAE